MKSTFSPTYFINIFNINLRNSPFTEIRDLTIINIVSSSFTISGGQPVLELIEELDLHNLSILS